jgi:hypothetical protein
MKGLEQDVVKLLATTLTIVVIIVLIQNAGGVQAIVGVLFGGWNQTLATLLSGNRGPQSASFYYPSYRAA